MADDGLFFSPSGRFACRLGPRNENDNPWHSVHFLDFEEETYREIYLFAFEKYFLKHIHWVDESTIGVMLIEKFTSNRKNLIFSKRPMICFYQIDFSKEKLKPKRIVYWNGDDGFPIRGTSWLADGMLTIQDRDYLVVTVNVSMSYFLDTDVEFADLKKTEEFNGNTHEYIWIQLLPKSLRNAKETRKIWINYHQALQVIGIEMDSVDNERHPWKLFANNNKLYIDFAQLEFLVLDIAKYIDIRKSTKKTPAYEEFCSRVKISPTEPFFQSRFCQNGYHFLIHRSENDKYSTRIWNLECGEVSRVYMADYYNVQESFVNGRRYPTMIMMHPSGNILEIPSHVYRLVGRENSTQLEARTEFEFTFLFLNPVSTEILPLQTLAKSQGILNRTQNNQLLPRCLREGRTVLNLTLVKATVPVKKNDWWTSLKKRCSTFL